MISIYGSTGFIGTRYLEMFNVGSLPIDRESNVPKSNNVLYFISTTHNYNVFENPHLDIDTNLKVLIDTLEACKEYSSASGENITFNFISSWFVYGETSLPAKEESYCSPKGFYSITKKCAEDLIVSYCQTFNMNFRILRLSNVYGKNDSGASKKKNALQYMISRLKNNLPIDLYHGGYFYRDYMHVTDTCRAIDLILENSNLNEIYNVGSGHGVLMKDIIDKCVQLTGSKSKITSIDSPEFHKIVQVKNMYMDNSKIKKLGFSQKIDLDEGLKELCQP